MKSKATYFVLAAVIAAGVTAPAAAADKALSFSIDYTIVSDYIWRGVNLSNWPNEGNEGLNHQMTVGVGYDLGDLGAVSGSVWFEWYEAQDNFDTDGDGHRDDLLQEVDFTLAWSKDFFTETCLPTTVELGWIAYVFPQAAGDGYESFEIYTVVSFDDSKTLGRLLGVDGPILNPYIAYYFDYDDGDGSWLEYGFSHDFALSELGLKGVPALQDTTITPSIVFGNSLGHKFVTGDDSCSAANVQYGIDIAWDIFATLGVENAGALGLTGFMYWSDACDSALEDEFWGGMTIAYEW